MSLTDYGKTLSYAGGDVASDLRPAEGIQLILDMGRRRFETDEGSWPYDLGFGYNLHNLVGENISDVNAIRDRVALEWLKDERVESVDVTVQWRPKKRTLFIHSQGESSLGPFTFTTSINNVTVEFLQDQMNTRLGL